MSEDNTKAPASIGVHDEAAEGGATSINRFLFRKTPPCPCRWETGVEETCNGAVAPDFIGHPSTEMRAVYICQRCGAVWDHKGDPLPFERQGVDSE